MRQIACIALACTVSLFAATAHAAPPEGKGRPDKGAKSQRGDRVYRSEGNLPQALVRVSIDADDARRHARALKLVGYPSLPPGIRKNLARGKPLPPGLAKRLAPQPLIERLPRYDGYEWQVAGADLVLVSIATAVIAEVLTDVFR